MSYRTIKHKGRDIFYVDYSNCTKKEETLALLDESFQALRRVPNKVRILINFENTGISRDFVKKSKELSRDEAYGKIEKRAVLGMTGLKKVLLMGFKQFSTTMVAPFDSQEEALEYLVRD